MSNERETSGGVERRPVDTSIGQSVDGDPGRSDRLDDDPPRLDRLDEQSNFSVSESLGVPELIDDPAPLSSLLHIPTLVKDEDRPKPDEPKDPPVQSR